MKEILFFVPSAVGHFNASLKISIPLQKRGFRITYGSPEDLKERIKINGFNYKAIQMIDSKDRWLKRRNPFIFFLVSFLDCITTEKWNKNIILYNEIARTIKQLRPDLVVIDSFCSYSYIVCFRYGIKSIFIQSMIPTDRIKGIPPLNSNIIPLNGRMNYLAMELAWKWLFLKKKFKRIYDWVISFGFDETSMMKKTAKYFAVSFDNIFNENVAFYPCLNSVPEIVTVPRPFDFPRDKPSGRYYINSVSYKSTDTNTDSHESVLKILREKKINNEVKIIYCSLGTLSIVHNKNCLRLIKKVVGAISQQKSYLLIVSIGFEIDLQELGAIPKNVSIYNQVPQLEVLKYTDLMITHGGANSVIECILSGVPMLSYPLNSKWDQNGNTSRIIFHKIGLRGKVARDSVEQIKTKLKQLMSDASFKENITKLKKEIEEQDDSKALFNLIDEML